ncbi:sugar-binding domain-containing protein [Spirosoma flavum]|uniref:Sugar-binding domain-containing protein n=1 Tax=Spirosoma flavum TaxID=2048557 RepID=A0ABW6AJP0_9BACT
MQKATYASILLILLALSTNSITFAQPVRQTNSFNDGWTFHKGDVPNGDKSTVNEADWKPVDLPHDWSIEGPFDKQWASATGYLPGGIGWYRKTFELPSSMRSKTIFLYFDGVYKNSEVWINGHYLGKRPNGFTPFQYEITPYLAKTGKNSLAVKVDHTQFADSRWYTGSGIYRNVYLVATDPVHIDLWGVRFVTPEVTPQRATATVTVSVDNQSVTPKPILVKAQLINSKGKPVANAQQPVSIPAGGKADATLSFTVTNPLLWSIEHPDLYKLMVTVNANGKPLDNQTETVGFRSFRFDKDKGFFLNGKNMKLKGVCIHDDAGALGVAVPEEVWVRRLKILKEVGCNSLRMSHNPHADYLYHLADKMGFLVMDEAFDEWEEGKNKWIKGWNVGKPGNDGSFSDFKEWANRDVADMVLRNRNRPSIIFWSIGNEIDYPNDPYTHEVLNTGRNPQIYGKGYTAGHPAASRLSELAKQLVAVVKQYDTTRPVTAALAGVVMSNEVGFPEALDVVGYNYQEYRYPEDHKKYPNRVMYGSENGMAYSAWAAVADNDYISGQYLWTGIDYLGEARSWPSKGNQAGLIDLAGFHKPEFYFRKSLWTDALMIYIGTAPIPTTSPSANQVNNRRNLAESWTYKVGDSIRVSCFTNCDEAELLLNGKSLGKKQLTDAPERIMTWTVVYQPGDLSVKGYKNGKESAQYTLKTAGEAYSIGAKADRISFDKTKKQLSHIEINVLDKNGVPVYTADSEISVKVEGPAKLIGLESGSTTSHEDYKADKRKVFKGRLLAYIQSQQKAGTITVTLTASGLQSKVIRFQ